MGKAVIAVMNWLSPKVSNPLVVIAVVLNGNAKAIPRFEFRISLWSKREASTVRLDSHLGVERKLMVQQDVVVVRPRGETGRRQCSLRHQIVPGQVAVE